MSSDTIPYENLLGNIHCRYCGRIIFLDYSQIDYANPDTNNRPTPRDPDTREYHHCLNKKMVREYERGVLENE